ncbi:hypothetical protein J1N35_025668 [Gossypium stocksii]|uniref:Uncharacterized protein n=1 Tax=Gossypium stocksii TaxID=47602 RepID=A0A9D3V7F7_9ROSI|nr:hypothetical protein J1N35_025668 [Gossypium stocksii]
MDVGRKHKRSFGVVASNVLEDLEDWGSRTGAARKGDYFYNSIGWLKSRLWDKDKAEFTVSKGGSSKVSVKMSTEYESVTISPKFKRRKVSAVRDFPPGCGRRATTDLELYRQIKVDQGSGDYEYLMLQMVRCVLLTLV